MLFSQQINEKTAEVCNAHSDKLAWFCGVDPRRLRAVKFFEECVKNLGAIGLKVYPPHGYQANDEVCFPMYEKAIELDDTYKWAYANLARLYKTNNKLELAREMIDEAIEIDSKYLWALDEKAEICNKMEDYKEAIKVAKKGLEIDSEYYWLYSKLYAAYKGLNDFNNAEFYIQNYI